MARLWLVKGTHGPKKHRSTIEEDVTFDWTAKERSTLSIPRVNYASLNSLEVSIAETNYPISSAIS